MTRTLNSSSNNCTQVMKFLYSYDGRILPRRSDGLLRYVGGFTRVLAVDRSITFAELMVKFGELCGSSMSLKCKLPSEDLDVLISITSDEDLKNVVEEYVRFSASTHQDMKIRAILFPIKSLKKISPPSSPLSTAGFTASKLQANKVGGYYLSPKYEAAYNSYSLAVGYPLGVREGAGKVRRSPCREEENPRHLYFVPSWNYSQ